MGRYTEKTTIARSEYLRLVGLLVLGAELIKQENQIIAAVEDLIGEKPDNGHARDALWNNYSADDLLKRSGITVVDDPTPAETHRERHATLHAQFDELLADFLTHNRDKLPSSTQLTELMEWSQAQTIEPTEGT